ncbi:hypothetical protein LIER_34171 [Lithospermum erythrorhizon]|uniref:Uncharacterized protein n=1 Tax=Lithospermum erythrorhizon TaxID=34254 RepID=A0AAV3RYQ7_LITER
MRSSFRIFVLVLLLILENNAFLCSGRALSYKKKDFLTTGSIQSRLLASIKSMSTNNTDKFRRSSTVTKKNEKAGMENSLRKRPPSVWNPIHNR